MTMRDPTKPPDGERPDQAGPGRFPPDAYIVQVAEQMAGPFWRGLSADQRRKVERYAAGYVAAAATRFADAGELVDAGVYAALPDGVRRALAQARLDASVYRTRLHLLLAYLASHDDPEIQGHELRTLAKLGDAGPDDLPRF